MSISQHAERILAAWTLADPERFETELESAFHCCQKRIASNILERERQELLESVVQRLRSSNGAAIKKQTQSAQGLSAGFALLQHLSQHSAA